MFLDPSFEHPTLQGPAAVNRSNFGSLTHRYLKLNVLLLIDVFIIFLSKILNQITSTLPRQTGPDFSIDPFIAYHLFHFLIQTRPFSTFFKLYVEMDFI
jgi:hypothetical protein